MTAAVRHAKQLKLLSILLVTARPAGLPLLGHAHQHRRHGHAQVEAAASQR